MDTTDSSETSVLTSPKWHHIPEDGSLHSLRHENLKSYVVPRIVPCYEVVCRPPYLQFFCLEIAERLRDLMHKAMSLTLNSVC
jgi:hypothetical protein